MKTLFPILSAFVVGSVHAEPNSWLEGTALSDCEYCKTDAFNAERRHLANQAGPRHDPASGTGYIVTIDAAGRFVWGRAALVGTGNLIRTDAHVLFDDTGVFKTRDGKIYFEPMQHDGPGDLIEIERFSVQRGGALSPLEADAKNDWAVARLREDAIEKFDGERVFAFLWDLRVTHDEIVKRDYLRASALVLSREHTLDVEQSCRVTEDDPWRHAFGVEEIFFLRCPSEYVQAGSSGSALAILSPDGAWNLGGQIVAGGIDERVRASASEGADTGRPLRQQLMLGNVPELEQALAAAYLEELIRRGMDPRAR